MNLLSECTSPVSLKPWELTNSSFNFKFNFSASFSPKTTSYSSLKKSPDFNFKSYKSKNFEFVPTILYPL